MDKKPLSILQVSMMDSYGGAAKLAWDLFRSCRELGYDSWMAVGRKYSHDPDVFLVPNEECRGHWWTRFWIAVGNTFSPLVGIIRGARLVRSWLNLIGQPGRIMEIRKGHEDFDFPGTWRILDLTENRPGIVHCHNLHGGYFDLRALSMLSRQAPVLLTLHDAWLLSGHCAHSFDCERWKTGCGRCPDLTIYPAVRKDATDFNWRRKRDIYEDSRLYVTTPCQWLMRKVEQSILSAGAVKTRIIPYGLDLSIYQPTGKREARSALDISWDSWVLLFAATGIRKNIWKDYTTMRDAVSHVAQRFSGKKLLFIALGEHAPVQRVGQAEIHFIPFQSDPESVARYYQAADIYLHGARADTFPYTVLEALACGTPVVASAVGGIPEQVMGLAGAFEAPGTEGLNRYGPDEATGVLVPRGDSVAMADALGFLIEDSETRDKLGRNAAKDAENRFSLPLQTQRYIAWYEEIYADWRNRRTDYNR